MNWKIWATTIVAATLGTTIVGLTVWTSWSQPAEVAASLSLLVLAVAAGWLFGMLISPYGTEEKEQFSEYAKIVSTALGGYLVGKMDTVFSNLTKASFDTLLIVRSAGVAAALLVSILIVHCFRRYAR